MSSNTKEIEEKRARCECFGTGVKASEIMSMLVQKLQRGISVEQAEAIIEEELNYIDTAAEQLNNLKERCNVDTDDAMRGLKDLRTRIEQVRDSPNEIRGTLLINTAPDALEVKLKLLRKVPSLIT